MKSSLETAIKISSECNKHIQHHKIWELKDKQLQINVLCLVANVIRLLMGLLEPFMPAFAAKSYYLMGIEDQEENAKMIEYVVGLGKKEVVYNMFRREVVIRQPVPLVREIKDEEV